MRGDGRIFTRNGSVYYWVSFYRSGKEVREPAKNVRQGAKLEATDANRREAEKYLKHRLGEVAAERHGGPAFIGPAQQRLTVGDLLDSLKADYELRGKWNDRVESTVEKVRDQFGDWRAVALTSEAVATWQIELRKDGSLTEKTHYQDATINRFCQVLGQAYNLAIETRKLSTGPVIKHLSEAGNARKGFFTETEIRALISHLPEYLKDFVLFGYITGMRKGEIKSLRWSDVYGDSITLRPENSKNGEARVIPLDGELEELIEQRRNGRKIPKKDGTVIVSEYVFHDGGRPIGEFRKAWATACKMANVPGRLFHDLRRCAARNLMQAGVPQAVAMKITGHKTDSMFRRYAIVTVDQQREALRAAAIYRQQEAERQEQRITSMPKRAQ